MKKQNQKEAKSMLRTLTNRSFASNRNRNLVAVFAIVLTTLMFTTLFVLSGSMQKNLQEMNFKQAGNDSHITFEYVSDADAEAIAAHALVEDWGKSVVLGVAENKELTGRQVEIRYGDEKYAKSTFSFPTEGSLPVKENEIALDTITLEHLGLPCSLGQEVTFLWRKDSGRDEYTASRFVLSGYWEGNAVSMASMAWVSEAFIEKECGGIDQRQQRENGKYFGMGMLHVDVRESAFDNLYSIVQGAGSLEQKAERILQETGLTDVPYSTNIAYDTAMTHNILREIVPMLMVMILVFASGYLIIYNIFQISVAADIRFYGRLKTLGASGRQLKKIIYGQANRLALLGIPLGLFLGYLLGAVLVPVMITGGYEKASVSASPLIFGGAAVFAWITVRISCRKPARMAGKVSPMEALRYADAETGGRRKVKRTAKGTTKGGGISRMALANLGRNKKRTFTVICSLTLGLVLLTVVYAKNASFDIDKYMSQKVISDFEVRDSSIGTSFGVYNPYGTTISEALVSRIEGLEGLRETGRLYSRAIDHKIAPSAIENIRTYYNAGERISYIEAVDPGLARSYHEMMDKKECKAVLYGIDGLVLEAYLQDYYLLEGTFDKEKFCSGGFVLAQTASGAEEKEPEIQPTYSVGEKVELNGKQYEVMGIVANLTAVTEGNSSDEVEWLSFYLPADTFRELYPENTLRKLYFNVEPEAESGAEAMLEDYRKETDKSLSFTSKSTLITHYKEQTRANTVMGFAISVIIALVGILNFVNSMVTAIVSRQKEFAMIQSVGMTKRQLRQMLVDEGLLYGGITLAASYLLGALAVGFGVRMMVAGEWTATFRFTLTPLLVCTPVIIAFAVLIPYLCFKNLEKQSIVERLRAVD